MFRFTIIFALPVGLLYLPVVIALRDAKHPRNWTLLVSATVIGPICLAVGPLSDEKSCTDGVVG